MARLGRVLRVGFVPEHFSTPLAFAKSKYGLQAELIPFPTGTGALASALKSEKKEDSIDIAIGLTEGFVADLGKTITSNQKPVYGLAGTYVASPLRWAISTGGQRHDVEVDNLKGARVGVSRIGSGSYVMAYVLADQRGWLGSADPYEVQVIGDFAALRKAVNAKQADFFMWEHFTTKHFWDNGELRRIGEIFTPWPSWLVTARNDTPTADLDDLMGKLNMGIEHYNSSPEEAIQHITTAMHYSKEDTQEWMKTVEFPQDVKGVSPQMIDDTIAILRTAGVLSQESGSAADMISKAG